MLGGLEGGDVCRRRRKQVGDRVVQPRQVHSNPGSQEDNVGQQGLVFEAGTEAACLAAMHARAYCLRATKELSRACLKSARDAPEVRAVWGYLHASLHVLAMMCKRGFREAEADVEWLQGSTDKQGIV